MRSRFWWLLLGLAWVTAGVALGGAGRRPNIVLILADDLGYGDLACYGHPRFKTPNLDALAAAGVRFTQFYACAPYCAPSRAALLTGRYPSRCGLTANPLPRQDYAGTDASDAIALPPTERTLADHLRTAGYATAAFGKWHLGHRAPARPLRRGFDEYLGVLYSNDMHPVELWDGDRMVEYPVVQATLTRRLTERALAFMEQKRAQPFFLYFAQPMPHKPLVASEAFYKKGGAGLYSDAVAELDWSVGQVAEKLRALGLERDTLLVFASDNGPWYGGSTGGLRGMKSQTYEGGIRVPLIVRWPGHDRPGSTVSEPGILCDVFTTSLAAAGVGPERPVDGRSLTPALVGRPPARGPLVFHTGARVTAVREGRWKLHLVAPGAGLDRDWKPDEPYRDPRGPDGVRILAPYEQYHPSAHPGVRTGPRRDGMLFDLETDPAEQADVSDAHPEIVARLREAAAGALR